MPLVRLSAGAWKWLVAALALAIGVLLASEVSNAIGTIRDGRAGTLGVQLADRLAALSEGQGTHLLRIERLDRESPLAAAGAVAGDRLRFDRPLDRWRQFAQGEQVGLTLIQRDGQRHLLLEAQPAQASNAEQIDYWGRLAVCVPALLFAVMVAFNQPVGRTYRCLALMFLALATSFFYSFTYSPPGALSTLAKVIQLTLYSMIFFWCIGFAMTYHPYRASALRRWLRRAVPAYKALALATAAHACWFALGREAPMLWHLTQAVLGAGVVLTVLSLVDGWRNCVGEMRQRHRWLLFALLCGTVPSMLMSAGAFQLTLRGARADVLLYFAGQLAMFALLTYAVLKHKVFNFYFAVSRALVFSVISGFLLFAFGLIEWLLAPVFHGSGGQHGAPQARLLVDAMLAAAVYLVFNRVHERIERRIEHFFFRRWHENAEHLRAYVARAAQITSVDQLLASLTAAFDEFSGHAGAAVYLLQRDGGFTLAGSTLATAAPRLDANDALAVALRSDLVPMHPAATRPDAAGDLALPMCHRGALHGVVLLGSKPHGESYRPDEVEVLGFATRQVGLSMHALRVEALEHAVRVLAERTVQQRQALRAMAGRRAVRRTPLAQPAQLAEAAQ